MVVVVMVMIVIVMVINDDIFDNRRDHVADVDINDGKDDDGHYKLCKTMLNK